MRTAALLVAVLLAWPCHSRETGPQASDTTAHIEVAFTPGDDVQGLIAKHIGEARSTVFVQAYLFTNRRIAAALVGALRRGVDVEIIGDAAQQQSGGLPVLGRLHKAGARIFLDGSAGASHNKIVIIDGEGARATVITGSYNFTQAAQSKNAENVVVISGNRAITDRFVRNFALHRRQSQSWP